MTPPLPVVSADALPEAVDQALRDCVYAGIAESRSEELGDHGGQGKQAIEEARITISAALLAAEARGADRSIAALTDRQCIDLARHLGSLANNTAGWTTIIAATVRSGLIAALRPPTPEGV